MGRDGRPGVQRYILMIDWQFIGALEGQSVLTGYVPDPADSASGVTIATGVDLGQLAAPTLYAFGLPGALVTKLLPYVALRGAAAEAYLAECPLTVTPAESDALDAADRAPVIGALSAYWLRGKLPAAPLFRDLPTAPQTVIASVAFQYGPELRRRCPRFWRAATALYWSGVIAELRNFGDDYPTRRNREADYLAAWLATA